MNAFFPLLLRRLRLPLILLIIAYSVAVAGFTLMPGVDDQGNPWRMNIFQAFYVVSYTGSTIGFGEVPYPFSDAQRAWTLVSIYLTVFAWLFAVGALISLLQDNAFRQAVTRMRLSRTLKRFNEPFYLIVGYGDCGNLLLRSLVERGRRVVVVENQQSRVDKLAIKDMGLYIPAFCADAEVPDTLVEAGLRHRWCIGVLAVTDSDHTNLKVAITAKLLNPSLRVCCRAETRETARNMASFGTDYVVSASEDFTRRLLQGLREPDAHRVYDFLSSLPRHEVPERIKPPVKGRWIICGYGRFGRTLYSALETLGLDVMLVDEAPDINECPPGTVAGKGTEAATLQEAGIAQAAALIACTEDDADNLSIIMTARELKPELYIIAVENRLHNKALYRAAEPELHVEASYIVASRFMSVLGSSLLSEFLELSADQGNAWNQQLVERLKVLDEGRAPETWTLRLSRHRAPALMDRLEMEEPVQLAALLVDPRGRDEGLGALALMLWRNERPILLPDDDTLLESGDRLLFCGRQQAMDLMAWTVQNPNALRYVLTGEQGPDGYFWRWLSRDAFSETTPEKTPLHVIDKTGER